MEGKKLRRSRHDRIIAGVCGGIGEYFDIDPVLVRLIWVLFALAGGGGILAYILAALIIPEEGPGEDVPLVEAPAGDRNATTRDAGETSQSPGQPGGTVHNHACHRHGREATWLGLGLVGVGAIFLLRDFIPHIPWWPLAVIAVGLWLVVRGARR